MTRACRAFEGPGPFWGRQEKQRTPTLGVNLDTDHGHGSYETALATRQCALCSMAFLPLGLGCSWSAVGKFARLDPTPCHWHNQRSLKLMVCHSANRVATSTKSEALGFRLTSSHLLQCVHWSFAYSTHYDWFQGHSKNIPSILGRIFGDHAPCPHLSIVHFYVASA